MTRVLVVNHHHSEICGIHDLGKRIHAALTRSTVFEDVRYAECDGPLDFEAACYGFDFVIVNHRPDLTPWAIAPVQAMKFAVLHQYEAATVDARAAAILATGFDGILVLDPLLATADPRVHAVGRPIPETVDHVNEITRSDTKIGSFGFAFPHKGFHVVAIEIADQIRHHAVYNLHMPEAFFNGVQGAEYFTEGILASCRAALLVDDVDLVHTADHLAERELVHRLALNDVNCLFYAPGQPDAGLSSALDYLIAARRPLMISEAEMFRHAWIRRGEGGEKLSAARWPEVRLGDVLEHYDLWQANADELYDFHHGRLLADLERIFT